MEELQAIVGLIATLGADTKYAFIAWLIAKYGSVVLVAIVGFGCATFCIYWVVLTIGKHNKAYKMACLVAREAGYGYWNPDSDLCVERCMKWLLEKSGK